MIQLPTEKSKPNLSMGDYSWVIYGPPGVGKTSFANCFENALILDLEGGTKHLECYSVPISCWNDVEQVYRLLQKGDHNFKTIVIDNADMFYRHCMIETCRARGIEHPTDEAYGKGADMVKNRLYSCVNAFKALGLSIVYTAHSKQIEVQTKTKKYTKTTLNMAGRPAEFFVANSDVVGYCYVSDDEYEKRMIRFKGNDYLDAKARANEQVQLPDECELNYDVVNSYFEKGKTKNAV